MGETRSALPEAGVTRRRSDPYIRSGQGRWRGPPRGAALTPILRIVSMPELDTARRDQVLESAAACFARYGYKRTSMETLAQAADMSRPALYQYFRNKNEIFRAMTEWVLYRDARAAEAGREAARTPADRVLAVLGPVLNRYSGEASDTALHFELIGEVHTRAPDLWDAFEQRILAALRAVLAEPGAGISPEAVGASFDDVAAILLYGAKGIRLEARSRAIGERRARRFVEIALRGLACG